MNCQEVKQHLLDYAYGELQADLTREVEAALEGCPECQQELARLRQVRSAFREALPAEDVPHLVHANIMREARRHAERQQVEEQSGFWETLRSWLTHPTVGVAAAAALVIVISLVFADTDGPPDQDAMAPASVATSPTGAPAADMPTEVAAAPPMFDLPPAGAPAGQASPAEEAQLVPAEDAQIVLAQRDEAFGGEGGGGGALDRGEAELADSNDAPATPPAELAYANKVATKGIAKDSVEPEAAPAAAQPLLDDVVAVAEPVAREPSPDPAPPANVDKGNAEGPKADLWQVADNRNVNQDLEVDSDKSIVHQSVTNAVAARRNTRSSAGLSAGDDLGGGGSLAGAGSGNASGSYRAGAEGYGGTDNLPGGPRLAEQQNADAKPADARVDNSPFDLKKAEEAYNLGKQEESRGNATGAIAAYDEAVRNAPAGSTYHEEALYHRALNQFKSGNPNAAIVSFRQVMQQYPQSNNIDWTRYYLAKSLLANNPSDQEAERLLDGLANGGGGSVAERAQADYNQAFGRREVNEKKKQAPARKAASPRPSKKASSKSNDAYDQLEAPADVKAVE